MPKRVDPKEARFSRAVEMATLAFWDVIASHYPEVKTGDVDPIMSMQWDSVAERQVRSWLELNSAKAE